MADLEAEIEKLSAAIASLESQRSGLGDAVVDSAIAALREQMAQIETGGGAPIADEHKLVTIVFTDVSGFTALSEKLDPEKVRELINACFDWLVPVVQKYDGTIDKFIGDEIMALFGAPIAHAIFLLAGDGERAVGTGRVVPSRDRGAWCGGTASEIFENARAFHVNGVAFPAIAGMRRPGQTRRDRERPGQRLDGGGPR
jgi:hypothetical protein